MPLGEFIGEIIVQFLFEKVIRNFFYYSGYVVQLFFNLLRKDKTDPGKRATNTLTGFVAWCIVGFLTVLIYKSVTN